MSTHKQAAIALVRKAALALAWVLAGVLPAAASTSGVVISQLFGGGATTGPYASDYVELFNAGTTPVVITGWSIQFLRA